MLLLDVAVGSLRVVEAVVARAVVVEVSVAESLEAEVSAVVHKALLAKMT